MPRRKIDILELPELDESSFSSGAVCEILGIEPWKLHSYLDGRSYKLSPSGEVGKGHGTRHWFYEEDIYRLGIAHHLFRDGFAPRLISRVLEQIEDRDFFEVNEEGPIPHPVIAFERAPEETQFELFHSKRVPPITLGSKFYYLLDVAAIVKDIDARIRKLKISNS